MKRQRGVDVGAKSTSSSGSSSSETDIHSRPKVRIKPKSISQKVARAFVRRCIVPCPGARLSLEDVTEAFTAEVYSPPSRQVTRALLLHCGLSVAVQRNSKIVFEDVRLAVPTVEDLAAALQAPFQAASLVASEKSG